MPDEQSQLPPLGAVDLMSSLNRAREQAAFLATSAVAYLAKVMDDSEEDTDRRIMAAAEILSFVKGPL